MMNITKAIFPIATASVLALLSSCSPVSHPDMVDSPVASFSTTGSTTPARVQSQSAPKAPAKKIVTVTKKVEPQEPIAKFQSTPFSQPDFLKSGAGISSEPC